ncbi:MAG: SusC/RagA family TonB-linked outer membrane protein [Salinivirgaceae bacterium]
MKKIVAILLIQLYALVGFTQVTGVIVDENNIELPGVSIVVQGTTTGTITNFEGRFEINAALNDTLVFSYIGYETQKSAVQNINQKMNINLVPFAFDIGELVVLGYSNKSRTEISSAVAVISSKKLNDTPSNDVAGLLQGKVSGVQVVSSSGAPGGGSEIRIRGVSTINAGNAEPLYVVDGIIGGAFDPSDVETLTVLKDAGATGMYGARANKGVIVVTTKSAKGENSNYEFQASYGFNTANHGNIQMMNGKEFYELSSELYRDYDTHQIDKIKFYSDYPKELESLNYNWVDEAFKPAPIQKYYLAASGNSNKLGYYISGTYYNEQGTFATTGFEKLNLRANTNYKFTDKISLKNNVNLTGSRGTSYDYMTMYYTYLGVPWDNPFNADGSARYIDGKNAKKVADGTGWWSRDPINPFHTSDNSENSYKGIAADYDLVLNVQLYDWLSFSSSNRLNYSTSKGHNYVSALAAGTYSNKGYIAEDQSQWFSGISTNMLHFNKAFGEHNVDGLVGVEYEKSYYETLGVSGTGLPQGFEVPSVASGEYQINGYNASEIFRSFISQVNYNYLKTYFLTGSYRIDETSNFPANNRVAHFPSISASVLLHKLNFLNEVSFVSLLKLRSSFGVTGDPEIGPGKFLPLFDLSTQYNGHTAAFPYQLANPDLTWEHTNQFNVGIDLELFKRVNFTFDVYNNVTKDLIVLAAQPLSQGFENRYENGGTVVNKGFELALSTINIDRGDFKFTTDFTFAKNSNELSDMDLPIISTIGGVSQIYRNGAQLYTFYLPKWLGVDTQTGGPLWEKISRDESGNIISREPTANYSEASPQEVGNALPEFMGGLNATLSYKNISLSVNATYQYGNDVYNATRIFMDSDGHEPYYNNMKPKDDWSRWEKPGDVATHPSMQNNSLSKETSSRYIEDGSYFKIRTISLAYTLPKKWSSAMKLKDMSVALTGNNLFVFTDFWGQDPEVTLNKESWSMPGVSDFKYPNNRQIIATLNVKF